MAMIPNGTEQETMVHGDPWTRAAYDLTVAKVLATIILGQGSFLLGVVPLQLTERWRTGPFSPSSHGGRPHDHSSRPVDGSVTGSRAASLLLCFGGGALLCTALLRLQPVVRDGVLALQRDGRLPGTECLGDLLFCAGFFVAFVVDELAHAVLGRHWRGTGEDVLRPLMSLRLRSVVAPLARKEAKLPSTSGCVRAEDDGSLDEKQESRGQQDRYHRAENVDVERQLLQQKQHRVTSETVGEEDQHILRGLFTILVLSSREIFEGMAIGLEDRADHVWCLFLAVAAHKLVVACCVGLELAWSVTRRSVLIVYVATYAAVTPVGIGYGLMITYYGGGGSSFGDSSPGPVAVVLRGLTAGTLFYVVFFEVLPLHEKFDWSHLLSVIVGFGVLLAL